jgi:hypothetical protein
MDIASALAAILVIDSYSNVNIALFFGVRVKSSFNDNMFALHDGK